jgi:hypothetical protein
MRPSSTPALDDHVADDRLRVLGDLHVVVDEVMTIDPPVFSIAVITYLSPSQTPRTFTAIIEGQTKPIGEYPAEVFDRVPALPPLPHRNTWRSVCQHARKSSASLATGDQSKPSRMSERRWE